MVRYDRDWRPYSRGRGYEEWILRGYDGFARARRMPDRSAGDYGGPAGHGHLDSGLYGPARYGLGPYYERLTRRSRPDDELKHDVEEALFYDTWVNADAIIVEVVRGVVTLRGTLPDYDEVRFAADDAWDVEGVHGVRCELQVDEGE